MYTHEATLKYCSTAAGVTIICAVRTASPSIVIVNEIVKLIIRLFKPKASENIELATEEI